MDAKFASPVRRLAAIVADDFILLLSSFFVSFIVGQFYSFTWDVKNIFSFFILENIVIYYILLIIYFPLCWVTLDGTTPGKKLAAIKIVKTDGTPITLGAAIVRVLGYLISDLTLGLAYLWILFDKKKQGLHGKLSKTYVVNTGEKPDVKLLGALLIGYILLLNTGNIFRKKTADISDLALINKDGSTLSDKGDKDSSVEDALNDVYNATYGVKIYEGKGTVEAGHYWGRSFEFYEKARLNIEIDSDYDVVALVLTEAEFLKFEKGAPYTFVHQTQKSPDIAALDAGKYAFVLIPSKEAIQYKVSLNVTKVQ